VSELAHRVQQGQEPAEAANDWMHKHHRSVDGFVERLNTKVVAVR
jgi:ABC-type proline/glycine betaine transport system substrate-binding protein